MIRIVLGPSSFEMKLCSDHCLYYSYRSRCILSIVAIVVLFLCISEKYLKAFVPSFFQRVVFATKSPKSDKPLSLFFHANLQYKLHIVREQSFVFSTYFYLFIFEYIWITVVLTSADKSVRTMLTSLELRAS